MTNQSADPLKNINAFWKVFNEKYAFFDVRSVDWQKQKETYFPQVTDKTSPDQLFEIMSRMIEPLNDGHVELKARALNRYFNPEKEPKFWGDLLTRDGWHFIGKKRRICSVDKSTMTKTCCSHFGNGMAGFVSGSRIGE